MIHLLIMPGDSYGLITDRVNSITIFKEYFKVKLIKIVH